MREKREVTDDEKMMEKGYSTSPQNARTMEKIIKKHHATKPERVT